MCARVRVAGETPSVSVNAWLHGCTRGCDTLFSLQLGGDALRATFDAAAEARDDFRNQGITLEAELKEATAERDAANKAAGVLQAKLDAATADIESNAIILGSKDEHIQTLIKTPKGK